MGIDGSLDRFTSLGSTVTSAPAFLASSMAALQSSTRRAMWISRSSCRLLCLVVRFVWVGFPMICVL